MRVRSAGIARTSAEWRDRISAAVASRSSLPREQIAILAPSAANSSAIALPSPLLPPVMSTTFPSRPSSTPTLLRAKDWGLDERFRGPIPADRDPRDRSAARHLPEVGDDDV